MKIAKSEFDRLYSENITKAEYDNIIGKVNERFVEICQTIIPKKPGCFTNPIGWFAYGNCHFEEGNGSEGWFDINEYKSEIEIGGAGILTPGPYYNFFPTRWLWEENFEDEFKNEVEQFKKEQLETRLKKKEKRELLKQKKAKFKEIIQSKLTNEELKYIRFK